MARQWQQHQGHARVLRGKEQVAFILTEQEDGGCTVGTRHAAADIEAALRSLGVPPDAVPEALARINLEQQVEFRDRRGARSRLWHDPKAGQFHVQALDPVPRAAPTEPPPFFCPRCGAVLGLWREGDREHRCPLCGHTVSRP